MDTLLTDSNCKYCGALLPKTGMVCTHCGKPLPEELADANSRLEIARALLHEMNERLDEIPPLVGWGLLLGWVVVPLALLAASVFLFPGWVGWVAGALTGFLGFGGMLVVVGSQREKIRRKAYDEVVFPRLQEFCQEKKVSLEDLSRLAVEEFKSGKKASILSFLPYIPYLKEKL